MSLVVILNNGESIVAATDKRIVYATNGVIDKISDSNKKIFITPQGYTVSFNGDVLLNEISLIDLLKRFIESTKKQISIDTYTKKLRKFLKSAFLKARIPTFNAVVQVSGINIRPKTKILQLQGMKIFDQNKQFMLCGANEVAKGIIEKICDSEEYKNAEFQMSVPYMVSLARKLIEAAAEKEVGKDGICPVSRDSDIVLIDKDGAREV